MVGFVEASMIAILLLLSCQVWDDWRAPGVPSATPQIPLVETFANDVRRVDDYLVPGEEWFLLDGINARLEERCSAGEDIRGHLRARLALVEVRPDAIWVAGEQVTTLKDWQAKGTKGFLIRPLYDALLDLAESRKVAAQRYACWPDFEGRLLFAVHPDAPWALQRRLFYSAGQAQFMTFDSLVLDAPALTAARLNPPRPPYEPESLYEEEPELEEEGLEEAQPEEVSRTAPSVPLERLVVDEKASLEGLHERTVGFPCVDGVEAAIDDEGRLSIQWPSLEWPGIEVFRETKKKKEKPTFRGDLTKDGTFDAGLQWLKLRLEERAIQRPVLLRLNAGASVGHGHLQRLVGEVRRLAPATEEYAIMYNSMPDWEPTESIKLSIPVDKIGFDGGFSDWVSVQSYGLSYLYHYPVDSCDEPDGTIRERPDEQEADPYEYDGADSPSLLEVLEALGSKKRAPEGVLGSPMEGIGAFEDPRAQEASE
jgi:hypothetical protein